MSITFNYDDKNGNLKKLEINQNIFYCFVEVKKLPDFETQGLIYDIIKNWIDADIPFNVDRLECELLGQIRTITMDEMLKLIPIDS
mgnify:CR=1 FL=1